MDSINVYNQDLNKDKDKFDDGDEYVIDPDDEDDNNDNSVIIAPYDLGDK